ncbi:MAG: component of SufBCD complex [Tabrizicola sp.]|uniref:component of SufBCD complex n=1 Tax=Tabrizicola sp. TaxID=2005166 RepID=UPI002733DC1F|nr:component of SufBCD complex [Tabrizicola sp.]MDP3263304.1 component of SufBCD complex [Tabrizicola sp.]MDP3646661.1 component of SufBCD complex [Paracoccaceae bacterium]MDZ4068191.1 component of SufBCD complex [Tabrizicola sp.]
MDVLDTVFEVIDMRSFSNLWYWIALAVLWSTTTHWVMGVPFDMLRKAKRFGGEAQADVEALVRIYSTRLISALEPGAVWIVTLASFWMSILGILAFVYNLEFAQAVFLLTAPLALVIWLSLRCARRIMADEGEGLALHRRLTIHRRFLQATGMVSIFITAMYGMWQNLNISILN